MGEIPTMKNWPSAANTAPTSPPALSEKGSVASSVAEAELFGDAPMTVLLTVPKSSTLSTPMINELALILRLEKAALVLDTATAVSGVRLAPCFATPFWPVLIFLLPPLVPTLF